MGFLLFLLKGSIELPKNTFFNLQEDKKERILKAALLEFSVHTYNEASTNTIVKMAEISKGSLFKYFENKEDLYFYVLDNVMASIIQDMGEGIQVLKGDIFEIISAYKEMEFNWYMRNPEEYRLLKRAFLNDQSIIYQKTLERYKASGNEMYYELFKDIDEEPLRFTKKDTLDLLKWAIEGFNEEFRKKFDSFGDLEEMRIAYSEEIEKYLGMLRAGIYKMDC